MAWMYPSPPAYDQCLSFQYVSSRGSPFPFQRGAVPKRMRVPSAWRYGTPPSRLDFHSWTSWPSLSMRSVLRPLEKRVRPGQTSGELASSPTVGSASVAALLGAGVGARARRVVWRQSTPRRRRAPIDGGCCAARLHCRPRSLAALSALVLSAASSGAAVRGGDS